MVVVMHTTGALAARGVGFEYGFGSFGVDIFFVISGFVMAITTASADKSKTQLAAAAKFLWHRFRRIVPIYWFFLTLKIVLVIFFPILVSRTTLNFFHIVSSYLFFPTMSPWGLIEPVLPVGWSLNFEMLFYVVFAVAILLALPPVLLSSAVFFAIIIAADFFPSVHLLRFFSQNIVFEFILGILVARLWQRGWRLSPFFGILALIPALAALAGLLSWEGRDRLLTYGVAAAMLVFSTVSFEGKIRQFRWLGVMKRLGDSSYSLYLSHAFTVPLIVVLSYRVLPFYLTVLIAAGVSSLVGYATYVVVEVRLIKMLGGRVAGYEHFGLGATRDK
ncbi:acyltransferase family protein [Xylophilus rhododendri]|uniref:Acyltransferase family protein n=1 Tax=Xylophilus rhododendri TaxID=2697032 RepID=A0A857J089_9BURK|nr:acyltransferase [Xylophilus rhododendri]QHI96997.1 acyltransferase family protein [Xylophilus rhododendri]